MQIINKKRIGLFMVVAMLFLSLPAKASEFVPQTIKIGLFYASGAKQEVSITSTGGIMLSVGDDAVTTPMVTDSDVNSITVKKGSLYHVETEEVFSAYDQAWAKKEEYKRAGFDAAAAYTNGSFKVWIGAFSSESGAKTCREEVLAKVGEAVQIISPSQNRVLVYIGGTLWTGMSEDTKFLHIHPLSGSLAVEGTAYRGGIRIVRQDGSDMTVINIVDFEQYLYGVVPKEVTPTWNIELLKAQAVAARTFAITNLNKYSKYGFHLDNTTSSQVYHGLQVEHPNSNQAVDATRGEIVTYEGKPAKVFFFASSGGKTESVQYVWGGGSYPYLVGVDDPYEDPEKASYARWTVTLSPQTVKEKLAQRSVDIGEITDVVVAETTPSGRAYKTVIRGSKGEKEYNMEEIRWVLGLYSTNFTVSREGATGVVATVLNGDATTMEVSMSGQRTLLSSNGTSICPQNVTIQSAHSTANLSATGGTGDFLLTGGGWGHGVGMSQWGAKAMADKGFTYKEILKHYFTGVEIE